MKPRGLALSDLEGSRRGPRVVFEESVAIPVPGRNRVEPRLVRLFSDGHSVWFDGKYWQRFGDEDRIVAAFIERIALAAEASR